MDASTVLAWSFQDEDSEFAARVLDRLTTDTALVPALWALEVANSLRVAEQRGRVTATELAQLLVHHRRLPVTLIDLALDDAFGPVLDAAREQRLTVYDAAYLHLALREGLPLATLR